MGKLLFTKAVDKSLLKAGLTIPVKNCEEMMNSLGVSLNRGEKTEVRILMNDSVFSATFTHVDMKAADRDVYQIRYSENSPICVALKEKYGSSENAARNKSYVEIWTSDNHLEFKCYPADMPSVKEEFLKYLGEADSLYGYQKSYKLVFYRSYFQEAMYEEEIRADQLTKHFRQFYIDRKRSGLLTEYSGADDFVINPEKGSVDDFLALILRNPFNAISKKGFFTKELSSNGKQYFVIQPELYAELEDADLEKIRQLIQKKLDLYYTRETNAAAGSKTPDKLMSNPVNNNKNDSKGRTESGSVKLAEPVHQYGSYTLSEALNRFINEYESQKMQPMGGNELARFIRNGLPKAILDTGVVPEERYKVVASAGAGNWATIPWLSIFDRKITQSAVEGVYIVYLLSKDTKRLYLTLNQGCTNLRKNNSKKDTIRLMHEQAEKVRKNIDGQGFVPGDDIDLGENLNELGELYQKGTIFYKEYIGGSIPSELELRTDLQAMIEIYSEYASPTQNAERKKPTKREPSGSKAWLLTWNPQNWNWDNYAAGLEASRFNEKFEVTWSCSNTHVAPGDNMYLIILGNNGVRGIIAAGKAISKVFEVPHWDYKKAAKGQKTNSVKVSFDKILDFRTDHILTIETLQELFPEQKWNPQGSGIEIKDQYVDALNEIWNELISKQESGNIDELLSLLSSYAPGNEG